MTSYYESPPTCTTNGFPIIVQVTQHIAALLKSLEHIDSKQDWKQEFVDTQQSTVDLHTTIDDFIKNNGLCKQEQRILQDAQSILVSLTNTLNSIVAESQQEDPHIDDIMPSIEQAQLDVEKFGKDTENWYRVNELNIKKLIARNTIVPVTPLVSASPPTAAAARRWRSRVFADLPTERDSKAWRFIKRAAKITGYILFGVLIIAVVVASVLLKVEMDSSIINSNQSTGMKVMELSAVNRSNSPMIYSSPVRSTYTPTYPSSYISSPIPSYQIPPMGPPPRIKPIPIEEEEPLPGPLPPPLPTTRRPTPLPPRTLYPEFVPRTRRSYDD
ncbi:MAG: hypothetical protein Sylvanvirus14_19 [Sylvanvirus sp.]|uniref:Uncharacterized protein n=1 Tax=Sylvanvirus sp. TaxID=2487774 RepID=A0A3G5AJK9_9VIRU|nr:MAG: hypothetical protein Sylvanvirus14_19 [Sylvanvirus sp.]